ncbi:hypothetical protein, partial [Elizabethkingia anophelis]|uniref:hypothetical protein n=1 Tax=Elizabethkingia anophelis TaxID=1117645 RepID=UPI00346266C1
NNYDWLINKSKYEVFSIYGDGENFYSEDLWIYDLRKSFFGIKETVIFIEFENDLVKKTHFRNFYFRIYI